MSSLQDQGDVSSSSQGRHLLLVGYRGSGKTTVAKKLASELGLSVHDTDQLIEQSAGCSIQQIFATAGEQEFRSLETRVIESLSQLPPAVVSLGGGAIIRPQNRELIRRLGKVVWLYASPFTLWTRIQKDPVSASQRPRLTTEADPIAEVAQLMAQREPWYREVADFAIDVEHLSPDDVVRAILAWLKS